MNQDLKAPRFAALTVGAKALYERAEPCTIVTAPHLPPGDSKLFVEVRFATKRWNGHYTAIVRAMDVEVIP